MLDSPSNCETKEMAEINGCTQLHYFCQSDFKQSPVKVDNPSWVHFKDEFLGQKQGVSF